MSSDVRSLSSIAIEVVCVDVIRARSIIYWIKLHSAVVIRNYVVITILESIFLCESRVPSVVRRGAESAIFLREQEITIGTEATHVTLEFFHGDRLSRTVVGVICVSQKKTLSVELLAQKDKRVHQAYFGDCVLSSRNGIS